MCGRFTQTKSVRELAQHFKVPLALFDFKPRYNLAPSQEAPVVLREGSASALALLRWGLIPSWAKDPAIASKLINARAESVLERASFSRSFKTRRCLIPADGFYEWRKDKTPFRFTLEDEGLFALAGLWDSWRAPDGKEVRTFTIITTEASPVVKPVHGRMPVILPQEREEYWLDPKADPHTLADLLATFAALKAQPVSKLVNTPANEGPDCAKPVPLAQPELWG